MRLYEDPDLLAAEFVLGTLEADERASVEAQAKLEPGLQGSIVAWERRLGPLHELVAAVPPPDDVWPAVAARLGQVEQEGRPRRAGFAETVEAFSSGHGAEAAERLIGQLRRWRSAAILAGMAALAMLGLGAAKLMHAPPPLALRGVLHSDSFAPPFLVAYDPNGRTLAVLSVPANTPEDRSYVIWLLRDGAAPAALGRIAGRGRLPPRALAGLSEADLRNATLAVSVEANNSDPAQGPRGSFLFRGKLDLE